MDILKRIHIGWLPFFEKNNTELNTILDSINFDLDVIYPNKSDIFRSLFYF